MAKPKRPSLLDSIETGTNTGQGSVTADVVELAPKAKPSSKVKPVQSTLYLPPQAHRKLREIAFAKDCKMHDLFIEGVNNVLASKGYPTVEELAKS